MKTNPNDVFLSFSKFKGELRDRANWEYEELKKERDKHPYRRFNHLSPHRLFDIESKIFLLTYIFDTHNLDRQATTVAIKTGKFHKNNIEIQSFLSKNHDLVFYRYILLKDPDRKYNIGYFNENIERMIRTVVELNIFFLDAYILCKVMDKVFNWKTLEQRSHSKTSHWRIGFNQLLMVGYENGKPQLIVNEDGLREFDSYSTGKISLSLYVGDDLVYCRKVYVPKFAPEIREAIFNGDVGEGKKLEWTEIIKELNSDGPEKSPIFKEVINWLTKTGLKINLRQTNNGGQGDE